MDACALNLSGVFESSLGTEIFHIWKQSDLPARAMIADGSTQQAILEFRDRNSEIESRTSEVGERRSDVGSKSSNRETLSATIMGPIGRAHSPLPNY